MATTRCRSKGWGVLKLTSLNRSSVLATTWQRGGWVRAHTWVGGEVPGLMSTGEGYPNMGPMTYCIIYPSHLLWTNIHRWKHYLLATFWAGGNTASFKENILSSNNFQIDNLWQKFSMSQILWNPPVVTCAWNYLTRLNFKIQKIRIRYFSFPENWFQRKGFILSRSIIV